MGFLGFGNFNKPGPGVNKDEPPKAAPVRYFEVLLRKFWKIVQANLIFSIPATVAVLVFLFFMLFFEPAYLSVGNFSVNVMLFFGAIPTILLSPFLAGLTIITRNFVREEHAFIWTDFWKSFRSNFKLFLINGIVCYLVFVAVTVAIPYYYGSTGQSWFFYIPLGLCLMMLLVFLFAQYYLPLIMVTFDLKYRHALKNALIIGIIGVGRNLLLTLGIAGIVLLLYFALSYPITLVILILLHFVLIYGLLSYTTNFVAYPLIQKYMIDVVHNEGKENAGDSNQLASASEQEASSDYWDELNSEDDQEDGLVYVNGRMIKKSELKDQENMY